MGKRIHPRLTSIAQNRPVTPEENRFFLRHLRRALILALKEQGLLNEMQYRQAEEILNRKCL